ncbi:hypothetical protein K2X33_06935 [bacterium]|nr:hypothetical protein [bacterium]
MHLKTILFSALIGSSLLVAASEPTDKYMSNVSLDLNTNKVTVTVRSTNPLELTANPVIYKTQPEYWLHKIFWKPNNLAGVCSGACTQTVTFEAEKNLGTKGVLVEFEGKFVTLGFEQLREE